MSQYTYRYDEQAGLDILERPSDQSGISVQRMGGELVSYRVRDGKNRRIIPLLYRDGVVQPEDGKWKNHATILFPIVGGLKNKSSTYRNQATITSRGNHGLARHSLFTLKGKMLSGSIASLHYMLEANDETRGYYPFNFKLELIYTINDNTLSLEIITTNRETARALPFSLGWHPGFRAPLFAGRGRKADCQLLLPAGEYTRYLCNEHCRLTGETESVSVKGDVRWTEDELHHTIMLQVKNRADRRVTLQDPAAGIKLHLDFADFPYLGLWASLGEEFICLEPWQGMDDHEEQEPFENKVGLVELPPGNVDRRKVTVTPEL